MAACGSESGRSDDALQTADFDQMRHSASNSSTGENEVAQPSCVDLRRQEPDAELVTALPADLAVVAGAVLEPQLEAIREILHICRLEGRPTLR